MASMIPPTRGAAFSLTFPIFDTSGKLKTGAAFTSTQVSKDNGSFSASTNAPSELATSTGVYTLLLTATEMTADVVAVKFVVSTASTQDVMVLIYTAARTLDDLATAAALATVQADTDDIQTRLPAALVSGRIDASVGAVAAGVIAAAAFAANALDAVWSTAARTLTSYGTLAADVWASATRTLTSSAAQIAAALAGSAISIRRGDTVTIALTGLGNITARTKLWFTVKRNSSDFDSAAIVQVEESGGLLVLNGATCTAGNASLVVNDATLGNVTITLKAAATTALLPETGLSYDVQMLTATSVQTMTAASASVVADVTRSTS